MSACSESTINRKLSAVTSFYEFHRRHGVEMALTIRDASRPVAATSTSFRPFLAHVKRSRPSRSDLRLREPSRRPLVLSDEQVSVLVEACDHLRDRVLLGLLDATGLRIGEALGLRHEDIRTADGIVDVRCRLNANGARAKTWERSVPVGTGWLRLHGDYLHHEYGELDSDYLFRPAVVDTDRPSIELSGGRRPVRTARTPDRDRGHTAHVSPYLRNPAATWRCEGRGGAEAARPRIGVHNDRHLRPPDHRRRAPRPGDGRLPQRTGATMRRRHDLIGTHVDESLEARVERARGLLEDLVAPAWRIEPPILVHPRHMAAVCAVASCPREVTEAGLCNGHALRWIRRGRPDLAEFTATTRFLIVDNHVLAACKVPTCRRGRVRPAHLCPTHRKQWLAAGQPPIQAWSAAAEVRDPGITAAVCRLSHCDLLAEDADPYCRVHALRWRNDGCRAHPEFEAVVMNYGDPRWDFRRLPVQLKLELQYGLQRSRELGHGKCDHSVGYLTRLLLHSGATTLLDRNRAEWQALFRQQWPNLKHGATSYVFLGFVIEELADLLDGQGWANEYPRDLWQLHRLGYTAASTSRQLNFTDIGQRWLVETAKRWLHWRLTVEEKSVNTVLSDLLALRRLSTFLTSTGQAQYSIRQLTRPVLEQHITSLHESGDLAASTIRYHISAVAVFLRALQDHEDWAPDLPRNAVIYSSDYPRMDPLRARGLNSHVMTQVRAHLPEWPHPDGRFLTELMIATGLRLGDACALSYDPLVYDNDANPYIRYWNDKMRREAYVPISPALLDRIRIQQQRTAQRFPDQTADYLSTAAPNTLPAPGLKLTPKASRNPDGTRGFVGTTYQQQLRTFQASTQICDEAGRPVTITAHQWRHTFATGLINRGVRLEVVKQLLDHASLEMSSHYARLLDTTIRSEWEAGRGPDDDYGHLLPPKLSGPTGRAPRCRTAIADCPASKAATTPTSACPARCSSPPARTCPPTRSSAPAR